MKNTKNAQKFNENYQRALDAKKRVARAVYGGKILAVKRSSSACVELPVKWWSVLDLSTAKPENITRAINEMNCKFDGYDEMPTPSETEDDVREALALMICAPLGMTIKEKDEFLGKITVIGD